MRRAIMPTTRLILALGLVLVSAVGRAGQADDATLDTPRDTIRANKKALVAASLTLSDDEAAKFWPLYDEYQKKLTAVNDRLVAPLQDHTTKHGTPTDQ